MTLSTFFDAAAPRDHEAFLTFAAALPVPDLAEFLRVAVPLSDLLHHRFPVSQRRRFESLEAWPHGYLVMGDAISSFNPVYGQGMTIAGLEAEALDALMTSARRQGGLAPDLAGRWFRVAARVVDLAWQAVAIEDYRLPDLTGRGPIGLRPLQWYMEQVHQATHRSAAVTEQFYRVLNFVDPPTALLHPRVAAKVLFGGRGRSPGRKRPARPR